MPQESDLARLRAEIADAMAAELGRPVLIEERAFQALEVVTGRGRAPQVGNVWTRMVESLPSSQVLLEGVGVSLEGIENPPWPVRSRQAQSSLENDVVRAQWQRAVRSLLTVQDHRLAVYHAAVSWLPSKRYQTTTAAARMAVTGQVTVVDLFESMLQSGTIKASGRRTTNAVTRILGRQAGLENPKFWSSDVTRLVDSLASGFDSIRESDSSLGQQQFVLYYDRNQVRLAPFGVHGLYQLHEAPLPDGTLWVARGNVIQPATRFSENSVAELEDLINSNALEQEFQRFFSDNPEYLLALGDYEHLHPQLIIHEEDGGRLIPDFFLEKMNSNFCDICDLKRPTTELVRHQRHRRRFRDAVMEAVAQLNNYRDWFDDRENREAFRRRYGLESFRPRVVVVIGRRESYFDEVERIRLESGLPGWVVLKTYDDVVGGARRWRRLAGNSE